MSESNNTGRIFATISLEATARQVPEVRGDQEYAQGSSALQPWQPAVSIARVACALQQLDAQPNSRGWGTASMLRRMD